MTKKTPQVNLDYRRKFQGRTINWKKQDKLFYNHYDGSYGLLLCANMDRLFDSGLISFKNEGQMLISSFVGVANVSRLHISEEITVNLRATNRLLSYLEYHRDVLFVK